MLGVAFANLAKGIPVDATKTYIGSFWTLLNPYGLIGGLVTISGFSLIGAIFLSLKTSHPLAERSSAAARRLWWTVSLLTIILLVATFFYTDINNHPTIYVGIIIFILVRFLVVGWLLYQPEQEWLGVWYDGIIYRPRAGILLLDHVSACDHFKFGSSLQPDDIQRLIFAIYAQGNDNRRPDLRPNYSYLPGVDLLDFPQTDRSHLQGADLLVVV